MNDLQDTPWDKPIDEPNRQDVLYQTANQCLEEFKAAIEKLVAFGNKYASWLELMDSYPKDIRTVFEKEIDKLNEIFEGFE